MAKLCAVMWCFWEKTTVTDGPLIIHCFFSWHSMIVFNFNYKLVMYVSKLMSEIVFCRYNSVFTSLFAMKYYKNQIFPLLRIFWCWSINMLRYMNRKLNEECSVFHCIYS